MIRQMQQSWIEIQRSQGRRLDLSEMPTGTVSYDELQTISKHNLNFENHEIANTNPI